MRKLFLVSLSLVFIFTFTFAGDFQEDLQKLAAENAKGYIGPFVTAFGSDMNAGLYHTALTHGILGFDVGVRVSLSQVPDEGMTYMFVIPGTVPVTDPTNPSSTLDLPTSRLFAGVDLEAPTVFGIDTLREISPNLDSLEQVLEDSFGIPVGTIPTADLQALAAQATFPLPPGVDLDLMPLAMPQFSLGLPMKTEVLLRYMPTYNVPDVGDINFLGLGVKHMVSQYIPACPVDISVQYVYQKLEVGDILSSTHTCLNVHASKKIPLLITSITPYVGLGIESSNLSVDYVITGSGNPLIDGTPIKFDIKGDNSFRPRVGFSTRILFFKVSADYAFGDYNVASLGVILSIR